MGGEYRHPLNGRGIDESQNTSGRFEGKIFCLVRSRTPDTWIHSLVTIELLFISLWKTRIKNLHLFHVLMLTPKQLTTRRHRESSACFLRCRQHFCVSAIYSFRDTFVQASKCGNWRLVQVTSIAEVLLLLCCVWNGGWNILRNVCTCQLHSAWTQNSI